MPPCLLPIMTIPYSFFSTGNPVSILLLETALKKVTNDFQIIESNSYFWLDLHRIWNCQILPTLWNSSPVASITLFYPDSLPTSLDTFPSFFTFPFLSLSETAFPLSNLPKEGAVVILGLLSRSTLHPALPHARLVTRDYISQSPSLCGFWLNLANERYWQENEE